MILVLMVVLATAASRINVNLADLTDKIYRHPLTVSNAVLEANASIISIHRHMKEVAHARSAEELENDVRAIKQHEAEVHGRFDIISERFLGEKIKIQSAREAFIEWESIANEVIERARLGRFDMAAEIVETRGAQHVILLTSRMNALTDFARGKASQFLAESKHQKFLSQAFLYSLMVAVVAIGGVIAVFVVIGVRRSEEELRNGRERIEILLASTAEAIYGIDLDGNCTFANPACLKMIGRQGESEILGANVHDLIHHTRPDGSPYPREECPIHQAFSEGMRMHSDQEVFWRADGTSFSVEHTYRPIYKDGAIAGAVCTFTDISERKQAELEMKRKSALLESSNTELRQFAYVASHDLQEPLRMVASYLQLLEWRYAGALDDDARTYIGFAVDGAKRMSTLIRDILQYSRIETHGEPLANTDSGQAIRNALANLQSLATEVEAVVTFDDLPSVRADAPQLAQLFQNLVGNALKYHAPDRNPEIHIRAERSKGTVTFQVRDNGIGIERQYFERIFKAFKRLHGKEEFDGTGIGLAICKKIVERHGGRIWVESEPGKGSTFYFTLPAAT